MAATVAMLEKVATVENLETAFALNLKLRKQLEDIIAEYNLPAQVQYLCLRYALC